MANLNNVVYLSDAQYTTLINNGSITVGDKTVTYNANDLYVTPTAGVLPVAPTTNGTYDLVCTVTNGQRVYSWVART